MAEDDAHQKRRNSFSGLGRQAPLERLNADLRLEVEQLRGQLARKEQEMDDLRAAAETGQRHAVAELEAAVRSARAECDRQAQVIIEQEETIARLSGVQRKAKQLFSSGSGFTDDSDAVAQAPAAAEARNSAPKDTSRGFRPAILHAMWQPSEVRAKAVAAIAAPQAMQPSSRASTHDAAVDQLFGSSSDDEAADADQCPTNAALRRPATERGGRNGLFGSDSDEEPFQVATPSRASAVAADILNAPKITVVAGTLAGRQIEITICADSTLAILKDQIGIAHDGWPPNEMRVLLEGKELEYEELSIDECGIKDGTSLSLVPRLPPTKEELVQREEARRAREEATHEELAQREEVQRARKKAARKVQLGPERSPSKPLAGRKFQAFGLSENYY